MAKSIKHRNGYEIIVDDDVYEWASKLKLYVSTENGRSFAYRTVTVNGRNKNVYLHREIMGLNVPGPKLVVDHINQNALDNRRENLRVCTPSQNSMNRRKRTDRVFTSVYKGVFFDKSKKLKPWRASIKVNRKTTWSGRFDTEEEAAERYNEEALKLHGEFAYLNR